MASQKKSLLLRIDPSLWKELEAWAGHELRSVNGQIEYLLREAIARRKGGRKVAPDESPLSPNLSPMSASDPAEDEN